MSSRRSDPAAKVLALRQALWANRYRPVGIWSPDAETDKGEPIPGAGKRPVGLDWREKALRDPPAAVTTTVSSRALNTGILADGLSLIDVDVPVPALVDEILDCILQTLGPTPLLRTGRAPKLLLMYRAETPLTKLITPALYLPDGVKVQVEVLGVGQQCVVDGIHPDTRQPYTWMNGTPADVPVTELPVVTEKMLREMLEQAEQILRAAGAVEKDNEPKPPPRPPRPQLGSEFFRNVNAAALTDIAAWIETVLPRSRYQSSTGAYRVSSADLGRQLQEDLSVHPDGIFDFGLEKAMTAIDLTMQYGDQSDPVEAAKWLCAQLRRTPESLGWRNGRDTTPPPPSDPPAEDVVRQLRVDIGKLSTQSTPEDINVILDRIADRVPDEIAREWLFKTLKAQVGASVTAMRTRVEQAVQRARRQRQRTRTPDWRDSLICNKEGYPLTTASNVLIALRQAPEWKGVLALDEFHQRPFFVKPPPWSILRKLPKPFEDADEARCLVWMQENGMPLCRMEAVRQSLAVVIDDNRFHPVRDSLDALVWDGKPRLPTWLTVYLGVEPIENYTGPIGTCWMISAVARIYEPGCPAKYCIILEGDQDLGKSTALEILGSPWFTDDIAELGTKDASMQVGNAWIVELSELASVHRARVEATKAFMSRKVDHFRKPFGRNVIDQERQSVLAATVNPDDGEYLPDQTGNVRFWPVFCTAIDLESLRRDRDQLWAEAVHRYKNGEKWHIEDEDALSIAREQQQARTHVDSWTDIIAKYLRDNPYRHAATTTPILSKVLFIHSKDHDKPKQSRIGIIMTRALRWRRKKTGARRWFVHPDFPDTEYPEET
jgi:predicted P-loop ATPase